MHARSKRVSKRDLEKGENSEGAASAESDESAAEQAKRALKRMKTGRNVRWKCFYFLLNGLKFKT